MRQVTLDPQSGQRPAAGDETVGGQTTSDGRVHLETTVDSGIQPGVCDAGDAQHIAELVVAAGLPPPAPERRLASADEAAGGATNLGGVEFRVDDIREYRKQGREMAVRNARERAEQIADAMGVRIVQVKSIEETTSDYPPRRWPWWESRRYSMMSQAVAYVSPDMFSEEPEIALGTFPITAGVSVAFEIEQQGEA
jgi:hypothetical protein